MPIFDVIATATIFRRMPDDSQMKTETLVGRVNGIVAATPSNALMMAAKSAEFKMVDNELIANCAIVVKNITA